jgi:hypothetical protein
VAGLLGKVIPIPVLHQMAPFGQPLTLQKVVVL